MYDKFPGLQRPARDNVEPDSSKAHAADKGRPLLLLHLKGAGRKRALYNDGGPLGRVRKAEKEPGIYEASPPDKEKRIILNNDNDDRRRLFETCTLKAKRTCNPIIDWTDGEVWDYIESEKLQINPLYQCGFSRVGCIGCPMAGTARRQREFALYPTYQAAYIRAFERMIEERIRRGKVDGSWRIGTTGLDVFHWWMEDGVLPGQLTFDDFAELMEEDDDL